MRPFAAVERFFERVFERPSARLFHARLQPIQLQRRVERAMETGRLNASDRVVVPNRYLVRVSPSDLHAFGDLADALELELADAALRFARAHHYTVSDRPAVRLIDDPSVDAGDVRVEATFSDAPPPASVPHGVRVPAAPPGAPPPPAAIDVEPEPEYDAAPPFAPVPPPAGIRTAGRPRASAAVPVVSRSVPVGPE